MPWKAIENWNKGDQPINPVKNSLYRIKRFDWSPQQLFQKAARGIVNFKKEFCRTHLDDFKTRFKKKFFQTIRGKTPRLIVCDRIDRPPSNDTDQPLEGPQKRIHYRIRPRRWFDSHHHPTI